jgi:hypothetical protein
LTISPPANGASGIAAAMVLTWARIERVTMRVSVSSPSPRVRAEGRGEGASPLG